jgi:hypothetical protein
MNGKRIEHIMSLDKHAKTKYVGFASPDVTLPEITSIPSIAFLNTGRSNTNGEHWCVICIMQNHVCFFFDSFGKSPETYDLLHTVLRECRHIEFNTKQVQNISQKTCGHHALYFALHFARGILPKDIMNEKYSNDINENDNMVYEYIRHNFGDIIARIE